MTAGQLADPFDVRYAARATGLLAEFNRTGVLSSADVHVATALGRLGGENDEQVVLAVALAVRAVRYSSVCVDLGQVRTTAAADTEESVDLDLLPWPVPERWYAACAASPLVAEGVNGAPDRPVRLVDELLYLDRYWRQERLVRAELDARAGCRPTALDSGRLRAALDLLFPDAAPDYQRLAAAACITGSISVVAGGPGTGKTTTVARLLALMHDVFDHPPRVALAAPTGKAAARLQEAVAEESAHLGSQGLTPPGPLTASTLHRLLGSRPGSHGRFKHDRTNRLPFDVVIVDETSMVSLTLMSRLLEAVRPDARLVLVGDPDQLASVEAGRCTRSPSTARRGLARTLGRSCWHRCFRTTLRSAARSSASSATMSCGSVRRTGSAARLPSLRRRSGPVTPTMLWPFCAVGRRTSTSLRPPRSARATRPDSRGCAPTLLALAPHSRTRPAPATCRARWLRSSATACR